MLFIMPMTLTEILHGQKFVNRVRELEARGHRFESIEVGATNSEWVLTYYSMEQDLFAQQRNEHHCNQDEARAAKTAEPREHQGTLI